MKSLKGFTMMELLMVILIVGILAALAIPTYTSYVLRANRAEAIQTLIAIQLSQEKYRMNNATYGALASVWSSTTTEGGHYTLTVTSVTATGFVIQATAVGSQASDTENGVSCTPMVLTYSAGTVTKTPAACWLGS